MYEMEVSQSEENYLKAIFKLSEQAAGSVSTNGLAGEMKTSAASVTDMIKRLSRKKLINYEKYKGVTLSRKGHQMATNLVRRHRLWEVFLVEKLHFSWDQVHEIAEQLEHIRSEQLVERLDDFLGFPRFDPHGDPIPDADGKFAQRPQVILAELKAKDSGVIVGVTDHSTSFLQYLDQLKISLGTKVQVVEKIEYDGSMRVEVFEKGELLLSKKVCQHLYIELT